VDAHEVITAFLSIFAFLSGWIMNSFRQQLRDNRDDIKETNKKMSEIEVLVAGKYVTRNESELQHETLLNKLDTIQKDIRSCMLHNRRKDDVCEL